VHHLVGSPLASGLFARAIAQSGSGTGEAIPDRAAAEARGTALMQAAGVSSLAELRQFAPIVDGYFLPDAAYVRRPTNPTAILTGMTADEMTGLNPNFGKATHASVRAQLEGSYGALAPELAA
jgi:para-nitrobenzyl esterase